MQMTFKELLKDRIPPQVFIIIAFVVMLTAGFLAWTILSSGVISVTAPYRGVEVFIDNSRVGASSETGEKISMEVSEGKHQILVSKFGFWPWMQNVEILKKQDLAVQPFLVSKELKPEKISKVVQNDGFIVSNNTYWEVFSLFSEERKIPEGVASMVANMGTEKVKYAEYFPGRTDVLIIAAGTKIFAVDAYLTNPRNYQPIFEGTEPTFVLGINNSIYIKDGETLYHLTGLVP